jgi:hypothetical protein
MNYYVIRVPPEKRISPWPSARISLVIGISGLFS